MGDHSTQPGSDKNPIVALRGVSKAYASGRKSLAVLRDLNLSVPNHSLSVVIGRSGSGKSTLLNLIAGLDSPDDGTVQVDGLAFDKQSSEALADFRLQHIGLVFQFFNLLPTLSLLENVALPALLAGSSQRDARERARSLLDRVGIAHLMEQLPAHVSGGEMQRAAIARALVNRPKLVLADEPTGNLDEATADIVFRIFLELVRSEEVTLLIVTHDERLIAGANHCFVLEHGSIRMRGPA